MCAFGERLTYRAGKGHGESQMAVAPRQIYTAHRTRGLGTPGPSGPLLEEPGGQAVGHPQVVQAFSRPLVQFEK